LVEHTPPYVQYILSMNATWHKTLFFLMTLVAMSSGQSQDLITLL
jgi:hypothetical protein